MSDVTPPEGSSQPPSEPAPPPPPPPPPADYGAPPPPPAGSTGAAQPFNPTEAFSWAWAKFQQNVGPIIVAMLVFVLITIAVTAVAYLIIGAIFYTDPSITVDPNTGQISTTGGTGFFMRLIASGLIVLVMMVPYAFLQASIARGGLMIADGKRLEIGEMFKFEQIGTVLVAGILVGIASMVGILLCYVGTLVVSFFTPFFIFFIVDKKMGAWESIMASVRLVADNLGNVFVLLLLVWVTYMVGAILCGIGLIVAAPVALLALTYGYRKLQGEAVAA